MRSYKFHGDASIPEVVIPCEDYVQLVEFGWRHGLTKASDPGVALDETIKAVEACVQDGTLCAGKPVSIWHEGEVLIQAGVFDNSTDWGIIGSYPTEEEAVAAGREWAHVHSLQTGYAGYGPTIRLRRVDQTGAAISDSWDVRAW